MYSFESYAQLISHIVVVFYKKLNKKTTSLVKISRYSSINKKSAIYIHKHFFFSKNIFR